MHAHKLDWRKLTVPNLTLPRPHTHKESVMHKTFCGLLFACATLSAAQAAEPPGNDLLGYGPNPVLYPKDARPFGKSIYGWADRSMQWLYAQPFASNPLFDSTGASCAVGQDGPVWNLAPAAMPMMMAGDVARACTVAHGKALLLMLGFVSDTYPCPDPNFGPKPGQSLYDFLVADAKTYPMMGNMQVSLDGRPIRGVDDYLYTSENLYSLKGDPSLQTTFDPCITTGWQPAINYGYYLMFRPLRPGQHTLVSRMTDMNGMTRTLTYFLTVQ